MYVTFVVRYTQYFFRDFSQRKYSGNSSWYSVVENRDIILSIVDIHWNICIHLVFVTSCTISTSMHGELFYTCKLMPNYSNSITLMCLPEKRMTTCNHMVLSCFKRKLEYVALMTVFVTLCTISTSMPLELFYTCKLMPNFSNSITLMCLPEKRMTTCNHVVLGWYKRNLEYVALMTVFVSLCTISMLVLFL